MKYTTNSLISTVLVAFAANLLIFYFVFSQTSDVSVISAELQSVEERSLEAAINLSELEGGFGYVGFIHHFKNYIVRRSDQYYIKALKSYDEVKDALGAFKTHPVLTDNDQQYIQALESTLNAYVDKLMFAKTLPYDFDIAELDDLVKIDDSSAEHALLHLRTEILPWLRAEKQRMDQKVIAFRQKTLVVGLCLTLLFLLSTIMTVNTLRRQASNVNELTTIFNATPDGIIYVDIEGRICKANEAAVNIFGYELEELLCLEIENLVDMPLRNSHVQMRKEFMKEERMRNMGTRNAKVTGLRKDGRVVELSVAIASRKLHGEMYGICVVKDMTKINALQHHSDSDHLTMLSNRRHFDYTLCTELNRRSKTGRDASLLMIDLDNFKELNDNYGHLEGDRALKSVAEFLKSSSRESDYVARWGGDEFVIFCPDLDAEDAYNFAERLRARFVAQEQFAQWELTLSIGIVATHQVVPLTPELFLNAADKAVYEAKRVGKNNVVHYREGLDITEGC